MYRIVIFVLFGRIRIFGEHEYSAFLSGRIRILNWHCIVTFRDSEVFPDAAVFLHSLLLYIRTFYCHLI